MNIIRDLVEWADKLKLWSTQRAIEAHMSQSYQQKDIESVLDARVWRGKTALRDAYGVKKGKRREGYEVKRGPRRNA